MFGLNPSLTALLIFCIAAALTFEFINGFHDTANAVATVIYTRSLKPYFAVIWSGLWNFIGVNVGGIAVAIGIINLLPIQALTDPNLVHSLSMILALIITAIIWNISTWYLGIPCSSSHSLIGSIFGVGIVYVLLPGNHGIVLNWGKISETFLVLLTSPIVGFVLAMIIMYFAKKVIKNKTLFKEPPAKKSPPLLIRSLLILTCTSVSFSHGSNDGQKGVGLIMIILIVMLPMRFALDHTKDPAKVLTTVQDIRNLIGRVDKSSLNSTEAANFAEITGETDTLAAIFSGAASFDHISKSQTQAARKFMLIAAKKSETFANEIEKTNPIWLDSHWISDFRTKAKELRSYTEYSPWWVILMISLALGLGTMVGWRRIVVTIGEKIGKSHLTYAQGATAELIAAVTIYGSSLLGLPVSTTHVLSSGVAGAMVSDNGLKNLQKKTVSAIGIAWLITLPVTFLLAALFFLLLRFIFG